MSHRTDLPASLPLPGISPELRTRKPVRGEVYLPPDYRPGICWVTGCTLNRYTTILQADLPKKVMPVIFGMLPDNAPEFDSWETQEDWEHYPFFVWVCAQHYSRLRNKHGAEIAYRYRRGTLQGYVKDYWF